MIKKLLTFFAAVLVSAAALAQIQSATGDHATPGVAPVLATYARPEAPLTPEYPPAALRQEQQGQVMVKLRVLASGAAADVQVRTSSGHTLLDEAALRYLRSTRFIPARDRSGLAVESLVVVPIRFVLED